MSSSITPSLPPNYTADGFRITCLIESGADYHLYGVLTPEGQDIQIREYCPHALVTRNMISGELTVKEGAQEEFECGMAEFESRYGADIHSEKRILGTLFYIYTDKEHFHSAEEQPPAPQQEVTPVVPHAQGLRAAQATAASPFKTANTATAPQEVAPVVPHAQGLRAAQATVASPFKTATPSATAKNRPTSLRPAQSVATPPQLRPGATASKAPRPAYMPKAPLKKKNGFPMAPVAIIGLLIIGGIIHLSLQSEDPAPVVQTKEKPATTVVKKKKPTTLNTNNATNTDTAQNQDLDSSEEQVTIIEEKPETKSSDAPDTSTSEKVLSYERTIRSEALGSNGNFSSDLLAKYPVYAEAYVRDYVEKRGGVFSDNFETWLKNTGCNREVFAMFYPVDPNVATNAAILVDELGLEKAQKYHQLVIAFAIGRREFGMGAFDLGHQGRYIDAEGKLKELRNAGIMPEPAELYCAGKAPVNWYGNAPGIVDDEVYSKVETHLNTTPLTAKEAWIKKYSVVSTIADSRLTEDNIATFLHEYMYRNGQLKRNRDPYPTPTEFLAYLIDKYETYSRMRDVDRKRIEWTGLSPDGTPWPALLALSETRPLRECDSVWERYRGERGEKRIWTYGPYRSNDDPEPPISFSFDPDEEWARTSNERKLHEGGVCGTMSLIARNSEIARGIPSAPAGQPEHGNLMTTHFTRSGCWLSVGQSVDTLKATTGYWYLRDSDAYRTGNAEYQAGLALSMNIDYEKFIASRMAMNIFKLMGGASGATVENTAGTISKDTVRSVMRGILKLNPFYTEAWYTLLMQDTPNLLNAMNMVNEVRTALPANMGLRKIWAKRKFAPSVPRDDKDRDHLLKNTQEYVNVLCSVIMEEALKNENAYSQEQWKTLLTWLKKERKDNTAYPEPQAAYRLVYANAQGPDSLKRTVDRGFKIAVNFYRNKKNALKAPDKIDQPDMAFSLDALCKTLPQAEMLEYMKTMLDTCPQNFMYLPKNKKETKIQPFFESLANNYEALADSAEQERLKELKKQASDAVLEQYNKEQEDKKDKPRRRRRG